MDREAGSAPRAGRTVVVVPDDGGPVMVAEAVPPSAGARTPLWLVLVVVALVGALGLTLPRATAYGTLMEQNLELKEQMLQVEHRMGEADRIMERLRLYDAQLRSLTEAQGDNGPLPPLDAMSNASVLEYYQDLEEDVRENGATIVPSDALLPDGPLPPTALQPADAWAGDIAERVADFVDLFEMSEADLAALMADLETLRAIHQALPSVWPAEGVLTSGFGWRRDPLRRYTKFHSGLDIANGVGTSVYAVADGTVVRSEWQSGYGNVIEIDHGFGIQTRYAHLSRRRVSTGDRVERGDYIAAMGSTGRSTGPHLHFELRIDGSAHDPLKYLPR
ncbi:MAG: M23 family metallopeptidase [Alphaproteobacteria bacterium]|nr:M23 family metallopeptidase [Alphaproteobacteria bacterium]